LTSDYQPVSRQPVRNRMRYTQRAWPEAIAGVNEGQGNLRDALALPRDGNPRTRAVAASWRAQHGNNGTAILAAAENFSISNFCSTH